MSAPAPGAVLLGRLDALQRLVLEASAGLAAVQFAHAVPDANHANWLIGHHLWEKDLLLRRWPGHEPLVAPDLDALYAFGAPRREPAAYPDCEDLRARLDSLHAPMCATLRDGDLDARAPKAPDDLPTRLHCALHFLHDASYHLGQLSYLRKALGL